jgi:hypothetical protein
LFAQGVCFDFFISYLCGIPEITLEGSPQDWEQLEARAEALAKWWLSVLSSSSAPRFA